MKCAKTTMKLKEIAQIQSGVYLKQVQEGDVAYLQVKDCIQGSPLQTASRTTIEPRMRINLLRQGDILFASKGATYLCCIYNEVEQAVASTAFFVIRIYRQDVLPEYLCWYLNQAQVAEEILKLRMGSGTPTIRKPVVEQLEIPVVDIEKQRLLVEIARLGKQEFELAGKIAGKELEAVNGVLMNELLKR